MIRTVLFAAVLALVGTSPAPAQGYGSIPDHRLEITPFGGYVWTTSRDVYLPPAYIERAKVDIKSNGFYGIALDFNLEPGRSLELLYQRTNSEYTLQRRGVTESLADAGVEFWQIGGLAGLPRGNILPFGSFTIGATRFIFKDTPIGDEWKFSMIVGVGVKVYLNERLGIRLQGRFPFAFFDSGWGVGCGTGGCGYSFVGTGLMQVDVGGGIMVLLGS